MEAQRVVLEGEEKAQVVLAGLGTLHRQVPLKEIREEILVPVAVIFILTKAVQVGVAQVAQVKELVEVEAVVRVRQVP